MLRETKKSVAAVALDVGYTNPIHFAQLFRRQTRLSRNIHAASSKSRSKSAILVRAILLRYFGGRCAWLQRSSTTPSKSKSAHRFSARIRQAPHDPGSSHLVDGRWSCRALMVQPRKKTINKSQLKDRNSKNAEAQTWKQQPSWSVWKRI
jgi:hypothetical protein